MKKLYFTAVTALFSMSAMAQGYTISPSNTVDEVITAGTYNVSTIDLPHDNLTSDSVTIGWELVSSIVPAGQGQGQQWDYSFCDYMACYDASFTSGTMTPIAPGEMAFFKVNLNAPFASYGQFVIKVFNVNDPTDADTLTFSYNAILELSDVELGNAVNVYPNPMTNGSLHISGVLSGSEVNISNSLGQQVAQRSFDGNGSVMTLNNLNLRRGVYFIEMTRDNAVYTTRKLIVK